MRSFPVFCVTSFPFRNAACQVKNPPQQTTTMNHWHDYPIKCNRGVHVHHLTPEQVFAHCAYEEYSPFSSYPSRNTKIRPDIAIHESTKETLTPYTKGVVARIAFALSSREIESNDSRATGGSWDGSITPSHGNKMEVRVDSTHSWGTSCVQQRHTTHGPLDT